MRLLHALLQTVNATVNIVKIDMHNDIKNIFMYLNIIHYIYIYNHFCTIIQWYSVITESNVKKKCCQNIYATQCILYIKW